VEKRLLQWRRYGLPGGVSRLWEENVKDLTELFPDEAAFLLWLDGKDLDEEATFTLPRVIKRLPRWPLFGPTSLGFVEEVRQLRKQRGVIFRRLWDLGLTTNEATPIVNAINGVHRRETPAFLASMEAFNQRKKETQDAAS
jgi:hypothetical protein